MGHPLYYVDQGHSAWVDMRGEHHWIPPIWVDASLPYTSAPQAQHPRGGAAASIPIVRHCLSPTCASAPQAQPAMASLWERSEAGGAE